MAMQVWTVTIGDRFGVGVELFTNEAAANACAMDYMARNWAAEWMGSMPSSFEDAYAAFFEDANQDVDICVESLPVAETYGIKAA